MIAEQYASNVIKIVKPAPQIPMFVYPAQPQHSELKLVLLVIVQMDSMMMEQKIVSCVIRHAQHVLVLLQVAYLAIQHISEL